jgi:hypothetical protein
MRVVLFKRFTNYPIDRAYANQKYQSKKSQSLDDGSGKHYKDVMSNLEVFHLEEDQELAGYRT